MHVALWLPNVTEGKVPVIGFIEFSTTAPIFPLAKDAPPPCGPFFPSVSCAGGPLPDAWLMYESSSRGKCHDLDGLGGHGRVGSIDSVWYP